MTFTRMNKIPWEPGDAEGAPAPRAAGKGEENVVSFYVSAGLDHGAQIYGQHFSRGYCENAFG